MKSEGSRWLKPAWIAAHAEAASGGAAHGEMQHH
jgi:hypothetical protein